MEPSGITQRVASDLLRKAKDRVFTLSVKYLSDFSDAEDATQDILIKIIQNYHTLKEKDKFMHWATRIATNYLINLKEAHSKFRHLSFDIMEKDCNIDLGNKDVFCFETEENERLLAELKIRCSQAMLMCLSAQDRMVYVLSSMFGINSVAGADMMGIAPDAFRKKLSRAKSKLKNFLQNNCGLVNENATCKCKRRVVYAMENNRIERNNFLFTSSKYLSQTLDVDAFIAGMEELEDYSDVFKSNPDYVLPGVFAENIIKKMQ